MALTIEKDKAFDEQIENDPFFISSQWRAGHVLTESDIAVCEQMYKIWSDEMEGSSTSYVAGFDQALFEIGGKPFVECYLQMSSASLDKIVRKTMLEWNAQRDADNASHQPS